MLSSQPHPWLLPIMVLFGFTMIFILIAKDSPSPCSSDPSAPVASPAVVDQAVEPNLASDCDCEALYPTPPSEQRVAQDFLQVMTTIPHTRPPPRKIECVAPQNPQFYSQIGQDKLIYETFFKNPVKCDGVVLEIGANDGSFLSNSFFFEQSLGWKSICVEANPEIYDHLIKNRPGCHNFNAAISKDPLKLKFVKAGVLGGLLDSLDKGRVLRHIFKNDQQKMDENTIEISSLTPNTIVDILEVQTIDYLSIDVEGAELGVLTAFDFGRIYVKVITVEANGNDKEKNLKVKELLLKNGFNLFKVIKFDEIYINKRFEKERA